MIEAICIFIITAHHIGYLFARPPNSITVSHWHIVWDVRIGTKLIIHEFSLRNIAKRNGHLIANIINEIIPTLDFQPCLNLLDAFLELPACMKGGHHLITGFL